MRESTSDDEEVLRNQRQINRTMADILDETLKSSELIGSNHSSTTSEANSSITPPEHVLSDYLQIAFMAVTMGFGIVFNLIAFTRIIKTYRAQRRAHLKDLKTAFLLLKLNLNISNLLILSLYNPLTLGWLITYRWAAGDLCCRCAQFGSMLSFHLSSFIVAGIAMDRLRNVSKMVALRKGGSGTKKTKGSTAAVNPLNGVRVLIYVCWFLALTFSVPQLLVWRVVEIAPGWAQCISVWDYYRYQELLHGNPHIYSIKFFWETAYAIVHLLTVFWLPFLVVAVCYVIIVQKLVKLSLTNFSSVPTPSTATAINDNRSTTLFLSPTADGPSVSRPTATAMTGLPSNNDGDNGGHHSLSQSTVVTPLIKDGEPNTDWENGKSPSPSPPPHPYNTTSEKHESLSKAAHHSPSSHHRPPSGSQQKPDGGPDGSDGDKHTQRRSNGSFQRDQNQTQTNKWITLSNGKDQRNRRRRSAVPVPNWRNQMRDKMFRTTGLVVCAYVVLWTPYNILSLITFTRPDLIMYLGINLDWLKTLMVLNAVLNPFLYEFGKSG